MKTVLESNPDGTWSLKRFDRKGRLLLNSPRSLTVSQVALKLKKSRRQIYRYLKARKLQPLGKYLGEWVVRESELSVLNHIPPSWQPLFPEHDVSTLRPNKHSAVLIPAILERGDGSQTRWLLDRYGKPKLKTWLKTTGWRLSDRSATFWGEMLGIRPARERSHLPGAMAVARSLGFPR